MLEEKLVQPQYGVDGAGAGPLLYQDRLSMVM